MDAGLNPLPDAVHALLAKRRLPILTRHDVWVLLRRLYEHRELDGVRIAARKKQPDPRDLNRVLSTLERHKILAIDQDFTSSVYRFRDVPDGTPEELCCLVDPLCYVSHLSALQFHGFSDRHPANLILTTPSQPEWRQRIRAMEASESSAPVPFSELRSTVDRPRYPFPRTVRGRPISLHQTKFAGESTFWRSPRARVATPAQALLDGLVDPQLCGGLPHVIDVWRENAAEHLDSVVPLLDAFPTAIVKVRAGYIIEDILEIDDSRVNGWVRFARRGGSSKLDPAKPYVPKWSDRWMLSINV